MIQWFRFYTNASVIYSIVSPARAIQVCKFMLLATVKFLCFWVCVCVWIAEGRVFLQAAGMYWRQHELMDQMNELIKMKGWKDDRHAQSHTDLPYGNRDPSYISRVKVLTFHLFSCLIYCIYHRISAMGGGPVLYSDDVFDCVPFKQSF